MAYMYFHLFKVKSILVPSGSPLADCDEDAIWREAASRIQAHNFFEDRLYQMLQIQTRQGYPHLLNYDWIGWS